MSLAAASVSRKERLEALRRRKEDGPSDEKFVFKQRNYDRETRTLRRRELDGEGNDDTVEKHVEGLAERIVAEDELRRAQELDLFNIAPKRMNWDLKRDMEKKLAKLERKTQTAMHTLIRRRLASQHNGSDSLDLAGTLNAQAKADAEGDDSDSD